MFRAKESLAILAYEGCRFGVQGGRTTDEIKQYCQTLSPTLYGGPITVNVSPAEAALASPGEPVTVSITSPLDKKTLFVGRVFGVDTVVASSTMLKDG